MMQVIQNVECDLFQTQLQTGRQIAIAISQRRLWFTRRTKGGRVFVREEFPDERRGVPTHLDAFSRVTEVIEVQTKPAVLFGANDFPKFFYESRTPVWRQAHDL